MIRQIFCSVALLGLLVGCSSSAPTARAARPADQLTVRPQASADADLPVPRVQIAGDTVLVNGTVRPRTQASEVSRVLITVIDRAGKDAGQYSAVLQPTKDPRAYTYRVRFAPVPDEGSSIAIEYQPWDLTTDYTGGTIGAAGGRPRGGDRSNRTGANITTPTGTGNKGSRTYGGPTKGGSSVGRVGSGK